MDEKTVFGLALGLPGTPWRVSDVQFDLEKRRLDIRLDFPPGSRFNHPRTGHPAAVYDTLERIWRHLNFFQFECYVHAFVPRVDDESGVNLVEVPWARPQSGFTLLMEALVVMLARTGMSVAEAARVVGEYPQRLWLILDKQVQKARAQQRLEGVETLSIDEVSRAKGHEYLTIISQPRTEQNPARVLAVAEGRESAAVAEAQRSLTPRGLDPKKVEQVCYLWTKITNGAAEALNGIIQTVKRKARGFKTFKNFATMIYLVAGRLQFDLPSPVPITHTHSS